MRNTDLAREVASTYALAPDAIERIVLGDGALPTPVSTRVRMDVVAVKASQAFDFEFDGNSTFTPPDFPRTKLGQDWGIGVVHGRRVAGRRRCSGSCSAVPMVRSPRQCRTGIQTSPLQRRSRRGLTTPSRASTRARCRRRSDAMRISRLSDCLRGPISSRVAAGGRRGAGRVHVAGAATTSVGSGARRVRLRSKQRLETRRRRGVHEDVVAHLKPRWLFPTAVVSPCWKLLDNSKGGDKFGATGDARYGCLALLHDVAAPRSPPTADRDLFAPPEITLQLARAPYYHYAPSRSIITYRPARSQSARAASKSAGTAGRWASTRQSAFRAGRGWQGHVGRGARASGCRAPGFPGHRPGMDDVGSDGRAQREVWGTVHVPDDALHVWSRPR